MVTKRNYEQAKIPKMTSKRLSRRTQTFWVGKKYKVSFRNIEKKGRNFEIKIIQTEYRDSRFSALRSIERTNERWWLWRWERRRSFCRCSSRISGRSKKFSRNSTPNSLALVTSLSAPLFPCSYRHVLSLAPYSSSSFELPAVALLRAHS